MRVGTSRFALFYYLCTPFGDGQFGCRRACGSSSVGRALASQAGGRGFETRLPLNAKALLSKPRMNPGAFLFSFLNTSFLHLHANCFADVSHRKHGKHRIPIFQSHLFPNMISDLPDTARIEFFCTFVLLDRYTVAPRHNQSLALLLRPASAIAARHYAGLSRPCIHRFASQRRVPAPYRNRQGKTAQKYLRT